MATHSSILAWRVPWTEEPGGLQSTGSQKSQTRLKRLSTHTHIWDGKHQVHELPQTTLFILLSTQDS